MTPEETLDWLAQQHFDQCREERPIQDWIRKMKSQLPAQPEQEPAKWMYPDALCDRSCLYVCTKAFTQFPECATTPPQRTWVGLTDEEINVRAKAEGANNADFWAGVRFAEAMHKVKE